VEYDVFLSYTWADVDSVAPLQAALERRGLRVFVDNKRIEEFAGITEGLRIGLASAKLLLAFYSRRYPTRPACQWELTVAFIAGQREGDPRGRVLAVNPEPNSDHVFPVELEDARYYPAPDSTAECERLARLVEQRVRAVSGPMGDVISSVDLRLLAPRVLSARQLVYRYPLSWRIHTALHARELPGTRPPEPGTVIALSGMSGTGKTSTALGYGFLFRDAFPGGVLFVDATEAPTFYRARLRELGWERFGVDLAGFDQRGLLAELARRIDRDTLLIIDGASADQPIDDLLIPSPLVRTIVTCSGRAPDWRVDTLDVPGLTATEGEALFARIRPISDAREQVVVHGLVAACGGHPMSIRATALALRDRQGLTTEDDVQRCLEIATKPVVTALAEQVASMGVAARDVLGVATVLAAAPIPAGWLLRILTRSDGPFAEPVRAAVGDAMRALADGGLIQAVDADEGPWTERSWLVHRLACDAVPPRPDLAPAAAEVALSELDGPAAVYQHAAALAEHASVPERTRQVLRGRVVEWYLANGLVVAAWQAAQELADPLLAARAALAAGEYERAAELAARAGDEYSARLVRATALDRLGRYAEADAVLVERRADVGTVTHLRLRGKFREALALLDEVLAALPAGDLTGETSVGAHLELAMLQIITGRIAEARNTAAEVVGAFRQADLSAHPSCLDAVGIQAEAELTVDMAEFRSGKDRWAPAERRSHRAYLDFEKSLGPDNPRTLGAAVMHGIALVHLGKPRAALAELGAVEQRIERVLGAAHPLRLRAAYAMCQATGQLQDYDRAEPMLHRLYDEQSAVLGQYHPDTLATELDLGIACALLGRKDEARHWITEARTHLDELGWRADLRLRVEVANKLMLLPGAAWRAFRFVNRVFWSGNSVAE
jgi:tetratricopeptide (TPR) repeat protein